MFTPDRRILQPINTLLELADKNDIYFTYTYSSWINVRCMDLASICTDGDKYGVVQGK